MSTYTVLARKWRPQQFADIIGQLPIVRTLSNAVQRDRIHQAYLFCGSRGVGKTSIARIFAKLVRCENRSFGSESPKELGRSCDQCVSCLEITQGNGMDVLEIDGASNNGVDAIRELRENAQYLPATGRKKIYIIDEVHMLSTSAFNALLKILEEPPAHVLFIFATTEPHKVPATIQSRCLRFDFKRVSPTQIVEGLSAIAKAEKLEIDLAALQLLAKAADGSLRDSLSLLDQVISYEKGRITVEAIRDSTGLIESETVLEILKCVYGRNPQGALHLTQEIYRRGFDLRTLVANILEYVYASMLLRLPASLPPELQITEQDFQVLKEITELRPLEEQELIFQVFHHGLENIMRSPLPHLVLDTLLIKCAYADELVSLHTPVSVSVAVSEQKQQPQQQVKPEQKQQSPSPSWEGFIEAVKKIRPMIGSYLEHAQANKDGTVLSIFFPEQHSLKKDQLNTVAYRQILESVAKDYFGSPVRISLENTQGASTEDSIAAKRHKERQEKERQLKESAENHPVIQEARALFGGKMGPIEIRSDSP